MALLKTGDKAPDFKAVDQDGNPISLSDFAGKKLVLYFYPKDDTPGCTAEACNLRDNYSLLLKKGYKIAGVSADDERSHKKFIEKYVLPFPLIADKDKSIIRAYGAWGRKNLYGKEYDGILRTTYVISENGIIERVYSKVDTKNHTEQILGNEV
jgi:peroxiredoxin Q/BCP